MKNYVLDSSRFYILCVFAVLSFMTLVVPVLYLANLNRPDSHNRPPGYVVLIWLFTVAWNWWVVLRIPYKIRLHDNSTVEFISLLRASIVAPTDMSSLRPEGWGGPFYVLRHAGGKVRLYPRFTGFHELVDTISKANPSFEIRGI